MTTILHPEIADLFRLYGHEYQRLYGDSMLPSHGKALRKIEHCRTEALGGQLYVCSSCGQLDYSYHSCNNRNCPKCGGDKTQAWIKKQFDGLLPVPYFFVTFTLPEELRLIVRSHQLFFYNLFFKTSSQALKDLAKDRRFVGGEIGFFGILQTWARNLTYHPHIHYIVPAVALSSDRKHFLKIKNKKFLIHVLPPGFIKVRYFGMMWANIGEKWSLLKYLLLQSLSPQGKESFLSLKFEIQKKTHLCPKCGGLFLFLDSMRK